MWELHYTEKPYFEDLGGDDLKILGKRLLPRESSIFSQ